MFHSIALNKMGVFFLGFFFRVNCANQMSSCCIRLTRIRRLVASGRAFKTLELRLLGLPPRLLSEHQWNTEMGRGENEQKQNKKLLCVEQMNCNSVIDVWEWCDNQMWLIN